MISEKTYKQALKESLLYYLDTLKKKKYKTPLLVFSFVQKEKKKIKTQTISLPLFLWDTK